MKQNCRRTPAPRLNSNSRGYLMLDLLIVMMLTIMILSTTSIWLYKTIRYTADVAQRDAHARNISRISRQLRIDARDAISTSIELNKLTITTGSETSIEYKIGEHSIHRKATGGDKDHHDDFTFINNVKLVWAREADSAALEIRRDFSHLSASKTKKSTGLDARIVIHGAAEASE